MTEFRPNPDDPSPSAPRGPDPLRNPMSRAPLERNRGGNAMWGWIAGLAVLILIGFIVVGGWGSGSRTGNQTAANAPAPATTAAPATTGAAPSAPSR